MCVYAHTYTHTHVYIHILLPSNPSSTCSFWSLMHLHTCINTYICIKIVCVHHIYTYIYMYIMEPSASCLCTCICVLRVCDLMHAFAYDGVRMNEFIPLFMAVCIYICCLSLHMTVSSVGMCVNRQPRKSRGDCYGSNLCCTCVHVRLIKSNK
jgi:hypothetical protein